jgi:fused signal recognition particle receptor
MAFWRRKKDQFVTLGLSAPATEARAREDAPKNDQPPVESKTNIETNAGAPSSVAASSVINQNDAAPQTTAAPVTPAANQTQPNAPHGANAQTASTTNAHVVSTPNAPPVAPKPSASPPPAPVARSSSFSTSILGLDRSIEELQAQERALEETFANRFRRAISATRESLSERIDNVFQGRKQIDAALLDELEEALIAADIGVPTTMHILDTVRRGISRKEIGDIDALKAAIKTELLNILRASERQGVASETSVPEDVKPYVMMIVGVNGVGKTTTIGKLASRIKAEGNDILICAADTFRAAASDQLAIWAERTGVPLIQQKHGTDPAAVLFDALKASKARGADVLIVDTAGRLHTKSNLMAELEKMKRVAAREVEGAPHETLLVIDAVTGQNGLEQARQFLKTANVTGIVLTKLDGTAKGGIAVAIAKELNLPIRYAGIGEKVDDLVVFDPEQYVNSLFE